MESDDDDDVWGATPKSLQGMEIRMSCTIGVPRILKWRGMTAGLGASPPVGLWGKAPAEGLSGRSHQKLKKDVKLLTFSCRKFRL